MVCKRKKTHHPLRNAQSPFNTWIIDNNFSITHLMSLLHGVKDRLFTEALPADMVLMLHSTSVKQKTSTYIKNHHPLPNVRRPFNTLGSINSYCISHVIVFIYGVERRLSMEALCSRHWRARP